MVTTAKNIRQIKKSKMNLYFLPTFSQALPPNLPIFAALLLKFGSFFIKNIQ